MNGATLTLAFSAGMAAAINPCGFALLPAYLGYYVGLDAPSVASDEPTRRGSTAPRAVLVGLAMTAGFVVVFAVVGALWSSISGVVASRLPWVTFAIGLVLIGLGIASLFGFELTARLPRLQVGSNTRGLSSVFVFGISYAVASLSCTIGIFISLLTTTFRDESVVAGMTAFVVYALGMGAIIVVLTVAVGSARDGIVHRLRRAMPHMGRISGAFMIVAGALVSYYGWWEAQVADDPERAGGLGARLQSWQSSVVAWIQDRGELRVGLACAVVVGAALGVAAVRRRAPRT